MSAKVQKIFESCCDKSSEMFSFFAETEGYSLSSEGETPRFFCTKRLK